MMRRRERNLRELYGVTDLIAQPEITPVLKGSCRIQGPVDEGDVEVTNTRPSQSGKRFVTNFPFANIQMKVESGTCNMCAAPCSSCMHFNRGVSFMASKTEDEFSDETCRGQVDSRCSFNDAGKIPSFKGRACNDQQPTASETSNLLSASSSHDSFSENAESKMASKTFDASEDVKMLPKQSSGGMSSVDQSISKIVSGQGDVISAGSHTASNLDQGTFSSQCQEYKGVDYNGDNVSCVSGANDADVPNDHHKVDMDRKNVACSSASVCSIHQGDVEKKVDTSAGCLNDFPLEMEESPSNSRRSDAKDVVENPCPQLREQFECSIEHAESSADRMGISDGGAGQKINAFSSADNHSKLGKSNPSLVRSASSASMKVYPCLEAEGATDCGEAETETVKCPEQKAQVEKPHDSPEVPDTHDPSSQSQPIEDSDGSNIEEDDVKVCDICGDAGREDLLAFCSRCSDGAEHTYCMRIRLDKVPEGDWLCEECKLKEEAEILKQEKLETANDASKTGRLNENDQSGGGGAGTVGSKLLPKSDVKDVDAEGTKVSSTHVLPAKRQLDNLEIASASKRQALETSVGSPTTSSPGKKAVPSRECSFKNLDKGKVKPAQKIPLAGNHSANNSQDTADSPTTSGQNSSRIQSRPQLPRGTLLKSNSFSSSSAKPKVKLMQDDVPQKQSLAKEVALNGSKKDGIVKTLRKSMTTLTGRSNATEAKVKMLPPHSNRTGDPRGIKQVREHTLAERRSSFKLDHPLAYSPSAVSSVVSNAKAELKPLSRAETTSPHLSPNTYRDLKAVQPDGKLNASMKPSSLLGNRGAESPHGFAGSGEGKRQTSSSSSVLGVPSSNGRGTVEDKSRRAIPKEELMTSAVWNGDKSGSKPDAILQIGSPLSREFTNQEVRAKESPVSRSRTHGGQKVQCNKCKEIGHATQFCPSGSPRVSVLEASSPRSSKESASKVNKLKEPVAAPVLRKPGIYKKNKLHDQSDELSKSSADMSCEVVPRDQLSTSSSCLRNLNSWEGKHDGPEIMGSSAADSTKTTVSNDSKQRLVPKNEGLCNSKAAEQEAAAILTENKTMPFIRESHTLASAGVASSEFSAIPKHDYIWHGGFEVQRSGRHAEICNGIQAHLSTRASSKVVELANKFPPVLQMEEVPRLSTWPLHFQEQPATEDTIALYFFAKDLDSYDRSYKSLLNNMIKNDIALKGNFDGIELLVFPSSQLAEKSQRWNMLFFLWGVFRGKKINCLKNLPGCEKKLSQASSDDVLLDQDSLDHVMPVSHENCSSGQLDESLSCKGSGAQQPVKSTGPLELPFSGVDLNCEAKVSSPEQESLVLKEDIDENDGSLSTIHLPMIQSDDQCTELKSSSLLPVELIDLESKPEMELQPAQLDRQNDSSSAGKMMHSGPQQCSIDSHNALSPSKMVLSDTSLAQGVGARSIGHEKIQAGINDYSADRVQVQNKLKDEEIVDLETAAEETTPSYLVEKENNSWESINRKRRHSDCTPVVSQASGGTSRSQAIPCKEMTECVVIGGESDNKKMKRSFREPFGWSHSKDQSSSSSGDSVASLVNGLNTSFPVKEQRYSGAYEDVVMPANSIITEKHLFPMGFGPVLSGNEDRRDSEVPNLELALGPKHGELALFGQRISEKNIKRHREPLTKKKDDDENGDCAASLALTLGFPFPQKEQIGRPVSRTEQLLPEKRQLNSPWLSFGGLSDT